MYLSECILIGNRLRWSFHLALQVGVCFQSEMWPLVLVAVGILAIEATSASTLIQNATANSGLSGNFSIFESTTMRESDQGPGGNPSGNDPFGRKSKEHNGRKRKQRMARHVNEGLQLTRGVCKAQESL